mmetsp:Transcript_11753/g.19836  ORF Transcript_11753/g.19836 Transcript_11753/m.19836 type:complete len:141 (-) Transcript_11753:50-472(-)
MQILGWVLGGYAAFHSTFSTISAMYRIKGKNTEFLNKEESEAAAVKELKLSLCQRIMLYMATESWFSSICCCLKNGNLKVSARIYEMGSEKLEEDFDLYEIIKKIKSIQEENNRMMKFIGDDIHLIKQEEELDVIDLSQE